MRKVLVSITLVLFCLLNATFVVSCSQHSKTASVSDTLHGAIKSIETDAAHSMVVMEDGLGVIINLVSLEMEQPRIAPVPLK